MFSFSLFSLVMHGSMFFLHVICIYLQMLASNTISISHDVLTYTCNTTGVSSGTGTAYPSGAPEFTPDLSGVHVVQFCITPVCPSSIYGF